MGLSVAKKVVAGTMSVAMVASLSVGVSAFNPVDVARESVYDMVLNSTNYQKAMHKGLQCELSATVTKDGLSYIAGLKDVDIPAEMIKDYKAGLKYKVVSNDSECRIDADVTLQDEKVFSVVDYFSTDTLTNYLALPEMTDNVFEAGIEVATFVDETDTISQEVVSEINKRYIDVFFDNLEQVGEDTQVYSMGAEYDLNAKYKTYTYTLDFVSFYYDFVTTFNTDTQLKEVAPDLYASIEQELSDFAQYELKVEHDVDENGLIVAPHDFMQEWVDAQDFNDEITFIYDNEDFKGIDISIFSRDNKAEISCVSFEKGKDFGYGMCIKSSEIVDYVEDGLDDKSLVFRVMGTKDGINTADGTLTFDIIDNDAVLYSGDICDFTVSKDIIKGDYSFNTVFDLVDFYDFRYAIEKMSALDSDDMSYNLYGACGFDIEKARELIGVEVNEENSTFEVMEAIREYVSNLDDEQKSQLIDKVFDYDRAETAYGEDLSIILDVSNTDDTGAFTVGVCATDNTDIMFASISNVFSFIDEAVMNISIPVPTGEGDYITDEDEFTSSMDTSSIMLKVLEILDIDLGF